MIDGNVREDVSLNSSVVSYSHVHDDASSFISISGIFLYVRDAISGVYVHVQRKSINRRA